MGTGIRLGCGARAAIRRQASQAGIPPHARQKTGPPLWNSGIVDQSAMDEIKDAVPGAQAGESADGQAQDHDDYFSVSGFQTPLALATGMSVG
jgi:hypothetical protein